MIDPATDERVFPTPPGRPRRQVSAFTALVATVLIAASLAFGGAVALVSTNNTGTLDQIQIQGKKNRGELCEFIDSEHNRLRADIVRGERLLYQVPAFRVLVASPVAEVAAYDLAKNKYESVRASRPSFCDGLRRNDVPPFPSLQEFKRGS